MNVAVVLAAGKSLRFGDNNVPKQLVPLGDGPVVLQSLRLFCRPDIDLVLLVIDELDANKYVKIVQQAQTVYQGQIAICAGSSTRGRSLCQAAAWLDKNCKLQPDDVIITHDAARPFCHPKIISAHLEAAKKHHAITTVAPSADTIACVTNKEVKAVYVRSHTYCVQTPQTLTWTLLARYYLHQDEHPWHQADGFTDVAGLLLAVKQPVITVCNRFNNMKITTIDDYVTATALWDSLAFPQKAKT